MWALLLGCRGFALHVPMDSTPGFSDSRVSGDSPGDSPADTDDSPGDTDPPDPAAPAICINEWMPRNESALVIDGGTPDWLELHNPTGEEIPLDGWALLHGDPDAAPPEEAALSGTLGAGAFRLLYGSGEGEAAMPFDLSEAGGAVGLRDPQGRLSYIRYGAVNDDFSVARQPDCCAGDGCFGFDFRGTPGGTNTPAPPASETLLPLAGIWRYLDADAVDADWMEADFDDSTWASGPAPLGYGDSHQVTVIGYGPDPDNKHPAAWFRLSIDIPDIDRYAVIRVGIMRDDGALLYANGQEVLRNNLPVGAIGPQTYASSSVGAVEEYTPIWFEVAPLFFRSGLNQLGAEIHQASATSSDMTFDLSIVGVVR
jgi:hypothetical protein